MKKTQKELIQKLNKDIGEDLAIIGDETDKVKVVPTGIMPLDFALGIGGIPLGRITDIYGLPSVGKSTICYTIIAQAQRQGISCALIDAENSYTKDYPASFGVDISELIVISPPCLEQAGDAIESLVSNGVGLIVVDSTATLVPRDLAEAGMDKAPMASQARGISKMLLKLIHPLKKKNCALIFVSQLRVNLMAMGYADKYTSSGGWSLRFYSSIRIEMKKKQAINVKDEQVGYVVGFKIIKNKLARPHIECDVPYIYDKGFDPGGDLVQMAVDKGIFEQKGAWLYYKEEKWNGKANAEADIKSDPALRSELITLLFPSLQ